MNELNEIDGSFSTLNENKFIDLILYGTDLTKTCYIFLALMWSEYVCYLCVYFILMLFSFSPTEISYIYPIYPV